MIPITLNGKKQLIQFLDKDGNIVIRIKVVYDAMPNAIEDFKDEVFQSLSLLTIPYVIFHKASIESGLGFRPRNDW